MFEHWKAYKNRINEPGNVGDGHLPKSSRAESFASLVSVISKGIADARSILSLKPGEQSADIEWMKELIILTFCHLTICYSHFSKVSQTAQINPSKRTKTFLIWSKIDRAQFNPLFRVA